MARTRKSTQTLNLRKYDVLIEDRATRSDYFKITQFDGYFYGGRNAFLIAGNVALKRNSKILIEILNVNGETVYSAAVPNFIEGSSRLVQVEVYADTPPGTGKIIILGCAEKYLDGTPVPSTWSDKFNVRWVANVTISPTIQNTTPIRFINTPGIVVEEKFYPSPSTSSFSQSIQIPPADYDLSPATYNVFQNGYVLRLNNPSQDTIFNSDYINGTLNANIKFKNSSEFISASLPITKVYNTTTAETRGVIVTSSIGTIIKQALFSGSGNDYFIELPPYGNTEIESSKVFIKYNKVIQSSDNIETVSFAKVRLFNLNTISGEVRKIRISYRPTIEQGEYILLGDVPAQVEELLVTDSGSKIVNLGKFNQIKVDDYWYAATMSVAKKDTTAVLPNYYASSSINTNLQVLQKSDVLMDALYARPEIENSKYKNDTVYFIGTTNRNYFKLFPNSEYTLKFDATISTVSHSVQLNQDDYSLEVYLVNQESGSGNIVESNSKGQLIGTLTSNGTAANQLFEGTEFNFKPKIIDSANLGLRFISYGGFWNIANVSLKPAQEEYFNPDEVSTLIQNVNFANKLLTFKADYLDVNNNSTNISTISNPVYFIGTTNLSGGGGGGASVTISTTPPPGAAPGDLWWNSEEGQLKIYYSDGDSSQWVDASGETIETGSMGGGSAISSSYAVTASYALSGGSGGSGLFASSSISSSYALTASYALVSNTGSFTGSFSGSFNGTLVGSYIIPSPNTLTLGSQIFYPQGNNGFSVNENFDASNNSRQVAYHFTSGDISKPSVVFSLARTTHFTNMFGVTGSAADNRFVIGAEFANTDFEFRANLGIRPVQLQGGNLLARITRTGQVSANSFTSSLSNQVGFLGTSSVAISASRAETASLLLGPVQSASFAQTASFLLGFIESASYALTASYALNGGTSSGSSVSASYAATASLLLGFIESASFAAVAFTASYLSTDAMVFSENAVPVVPTTSSYSFIRTGSLGGKVKNISTGIRLETTSSTSNSNQLIYALSTVTTGSGGWQATGRFRSHAPQNNWTMTGIVIKDTNITGSGVSMGRGSDSVVGFNRNTWTSDTTFGSVIGAVIWHDPNFWLRVVESPVSRSWFVSTDGDFWQRFYAEARLGNAVVTGSYVGPFINPNYGTVASTNLQNTPTAVDCLSWKVEPL